MNLLIDLIVYASEFTAYTLGYQDRPDPM